MLSCFRGDLQYASNNASCTALFIDAENISYKWAARIVGIAKEKGEVFVKEAYANWREPALKNWVEQARKFGLSPVDCFSTAKRNSLDIALTVGAMDTCLTCPWITTFVLATNDGDFSALANYLLKKGRTVVGVGTDAASGYFRAAVSEFYELRGDIPALARTSALDAKAVNVLKRYTCKGGWFTGSQLRQYLDASGLRAFNVKDVGFEKWLTATGMFDVRKPNNRPPSLFRLKKEYQ